MAAETEQDRCWICLLGEGEDSVSQGKLLRVCKCSLRAHKGCLIEWAAQQERDRKNAANDGAGDGEPVARAQPQEPPQPQNPADNLLVGVGFGTRMTTLNLGRLFDLFDFTASSPADSLYTGRNSFLGLRKPAFKVDLYCPQCKSKLYFTSFRHPLLSLADSVKTFAKNTSKVVLLASGIQVLVSTAVISIVGLLATAGRYMSDSFVPQSTLLKLLNYRDLSMNSVGPKYILYLGGLPLYVLGTLRSQARLPWLVQHWFPLLFIADNSDHMSIKWPFLLAPVVKNAYNFVYSFTINRLYYRWSSDLKPLELTKGLDGWDKKFFNKIAKDQDLIMENNASSSAKDTTERLVEDYKRHNPLVQVPCLLEEDLPGPERVRNAFKRFLLVSKDFSKDFISSSVYIKLLSSFAWPYLSSLLSENVLIKLPILTDYLNRFGSTPDDVMFLRNCLSACLCVLAKDLFNLFIVWRKYKELNEVEILEYGTKEWRASSNTVERPPQPLGLPAPPQQQQQQLPGEFPRLEDFPPQWYNAHPQLRFEDLDPEEVFGPGFVPPQRPQDPAQGLQVPRALDQGEYVNIDGEVYRHHPENVVPVDEWRDVVREYSTQHPSVRPFVRAEMLRNYGVDLEVLLRDGFN